ncbi:endolytic transglycosylase MltG [Sphingosinicella sp.]|uniref:endolytic transglycosylase MltG n=1 Tax=Sphingosinicella sp. TaxID=1917971 RepID=UPI0040380692
MAQPKRRRRRRLGARLKRGVLVLIVLFVLLVAAAGGATWLLWIGPGPTEQPTTFIVAQGSGTARIAAQLEQAGAIRGNAITFRIFARLFGSHAPLQQGEFLIRPGMSPAAILDMLQFGQPVRRMVTIPEGMPSVLVRDRLMAIPYLTGDIEVPPEGSVLPNTYDFRRGETRAAVLARMQRAMTETLARLWARRRQGSVVQSPQAAIILASIVEKETSRESERRTIAGVYSNRLRQGMPLQADPTVIYPITQGRPLGRRILRSELLARNGYNTYVLAGLPIGPIANPGRASIAAVLDPQDTQALFFVADGSGGHIFANTLAEHNANVQRWYAIRRARGEMN